MGWKSNVRSFGSALNKMSRDSRKRQRELEQRAKYVSKLQEIERNQLEVEQYENYIDRITSLHKECSEQIDWNQIIALTAPIEPVYQNSNESFAQQELEHYKPNFIVKMFKMDKKRIIKIQNKIELTKEQDKNEFQNKKVEYNRELSEYNTLIRIANKILTKDLSGFEEALNFFQPFQEFGEFGSSIKFHFINDKNVYIDFHVHDKKLIPTTIKTLLKTGKVSYKEMTISKGNEIYQDYICSAILRIALEMYAIFPLDNIIISAIGSVLNTSNGQLEDQPILSVFIPRNSFEKINLEYIDPSNSLENFIHNMSFTKTNGFKAVKKIDFTNLKL
jgi:hypothetical protein